LHNVTGVHEELSAASSAQQLLLSGRMDLSLTGTVVLGATFIPFVVEVFFQTRLLTLFLEALPERARSTLPRHPRRRSLAFLGSTRFHLAVWRSFRRDLTEDPPPVIVLKRRMRLSLWRELIWGTCFGATLAVLLAVGWRPIWP
jgi:hypothetical protein